MDIKDIFLCKNCLSYMDTNNNKLVSLEALSENNIDSEKVNRTYCRSCLRYMNWENETYKF